MVNGRLIYTVAQVLTDTANQEVVEGVEEGDDPSAHVRGSLMLATVATEVAIGTSREELLDMISRVYDAVAPEEITSVRCKQAIAN